MSNESHPTREFRSPLPPPIVAGSTPPSGDYRRVADERYRGRGFTLASLFLLMTTCGTLVALWIPLVTALRQGNVSGRLTVLAAIVSGLIGGFFGILVGVLQRRPLQGSAMGIVAGCALGLLLGPLALVPDELAGGVLRSSLFGSIAILVVAVALRRL